MITHPRVNRGLVPDAVDRGTPRQLVLVQARDDEGFWSNVHEPATVKEAIRLAEAWTKETGGETRVCQGPKREVVREFFAPTPKGFDGREGR